MLRSPSAIIATLILLAGGCLAPEPAPTTEPAPSSASQPTDPSAILAALQLTAKPEGKRALADLEKFVTAAPRRFDNQHQHEAARVWLEKAFADAGLETSRHKFTGASQTPQGPQVTGQNIIGKLPGKDPDKWIIFGAHYDGAFNGYGAAYDDGGGTLIVVELARALAKYEWQHTLVFAAWDQEEAGLVGSTAWVKDLKATETEVVHYMNFDMTGINWPAKFGGTVDVPLKVSFGGDGQDHVLALWTAAAQHLKFPGGSSTAATGATASSSDHASFLRAEYPASWVRGAVIGQYPMYHNADTVETMIADVGGKRADLEAGFDTALQLVFIWAFLVDAMPPPAT